MTGKIAYLDCYAGISGDMFLGALLDAGLPLAYLKGELRKLPLTGYELSSRAEQRKGIRGKRFIVKINKKRQKERYLRDILRIIAGSKLPPVIKDKSVSLFQLLAGAEARVHGGRPETVHFHEVGAVDSIIDIIGAVIGVHYLSLEKIYASPLRISSVPAPASLELLAGMDARVEGTGRDKEMVTPTGAVLLKGFALRFGALPRMKLTGISYGIGSRDDADLSNSLRVVIGQPVKKDLAEADIIYQVQTNIDDMNPQLYEGLMESLFRQGALDVFWVPVQAKKNRPGIQVTVLCPVSSLEKIIAVVFKETTSFGLRYWQAERRTLHRKFRAVSTPFGKVKAKVGSYGDKILKIKPEYKDCKKLAAKRGIAVKDLIANFE